MAEINGEGTIIQLEKDKPKSKCRRWKIEVSLGRNLATGKYDKRSRTVRGTYTDAVNARREFIAELKRGCATRKKPRAFRDYAAAWLEERKSLVALDTWKRDAYHIDNLNLHIGAARMGEVTAAVLDKCYTALMDGESVSGRPLSGTYVANVAATAHTIFRDAMADHLITFNPCDFAHPPAKDTAERKSLRKKGIDDLLAKLSPKAPSPFVIRMAVKSGMRRGEVVGLSMEDLDFKAKLVHVRHGTESTSRLKATKTETGRRTLPMTPGMEEDFKERIAAMEKEFADTREKMGTDVPRLGPKTPLVCNELGERLRPDAPTRWWRRNRKALGFDQWTVHEMRHSYLSELARRKVEPKVLQKLAGHRSFQTTMDIYVHVDLEDAMEAVERVDW